MRPWAERARLGVDAVTTGQLDHQLLGNEVAELSQHAQLGSGLVEVT